MPMIDHTRHSGIFLLNDKTVTLIGAGGIGALTAISLGKMGIASLRIFDDDTVDDINLATQFHKVSDVGSPKTFSVANNVYDFSGLSQIVRATRRVDEHTDLRDWAVISAVDSINARKEIWGAVKASKPAWYLDARMSSEVFHLYVVDMSKMLSIDFYDTLINAVNEEDVSEEPCTSKATIYTSCISSGLICKTIRQIATGIVPPRYLVHDIVNDNLTVIQ